ncbi:MAG: nucleoside-triphosphatase, partial [Candidatus Aminicenantales bacterium]
HAILRDGDFLSANQGFLLQIDLVSWLFYLCPMILVLTGPVHSGKTSLVQRVVARLRKENFSLDGYLSLAVVKDGAVVGYDLFDLATERAVPFLRKKSQKDGLTVGPYYFVPGALKKAHQKILESSPQDFLVVDEVGPAEVQGQGIWPALSTVLEKPSRRCLLIVRSSILRDVLKPIGPDRVEVLEVGRKEAEAVLFRKIIESA